VQGREVVIVEAVRTPVGRGHPEKGDFRDVHPVALLGHVYADVVARAGVDPALVEDVLAGCVHQLGEQQYNIARNAWLHAGLPVETPALTLDRQCGSAQQAVNLGATLIAAGVHDVVIGAGVEHMGHLPFTAGAAVMAELGSPYTPELLERHELVPQGLSAELIAERWDISREECDSFALTSQQRAARATEEGRFEREITPVETPDGLVTRDQGIRPDTSLEGLAALRAAFKENGRHTAGNSSQISDGAAAILLMERGRADSLGLRARARIVDQTTVGVDPVIMLTGPIPATQRIVERNGLGLDDIDLIEINEAFASVVLAWQRELEADMTRVNVNGGAIALGHPIGSTGARLLTTLLHELERTEQRLGLVTMCCGGGLGTATLIERL
jgi:acetyl-CoA acetyltransferase family protein